MTTQMKSIEAMILEGKIQDLALILLEATYGRRTMGSSGPPILTTSSEHILRKMAHKKLHETFEDAVARQNEASMSRYRVVNTDNFGGDYPDESFASPSLTRENAKAVADIFNSEHCAEDSSPRFWKVVELPYELRPGFEP